MDLSLQATLAGTAATIAVFGIAGHLYVATKRRLAAETSLPAQLLLGLLFGLCAVAAMLIPLRLLPDMPVSGGPIAVALAAPFGGTLATGIAMLLATGFRLAFGGAAVLTDTAEIVAAALIGLLVTAIASRRRTDDVRRLAALALVLPSVACLGLASGGPAAATAVIESAVFLLLGVLCFGALLLERLAAERRVAESDERFEALAANVPGVVFQAATRPNGDVGFSHLSLEATRFLRLAPEDAKADPDRALRMIHPEDVEPFQRSLREAGADLSLWSHDFRIVDGDGNVRWLHGRARARRLPAGDIVWHGAMVEVTQRKEREEAFRRVEKHYRLIAESTTDVIQVTATDGTRSYVSPSATQLLGYSITELVGQPAEALLHPADLEAVRAARRQAAGESGPAVLSYRLRRKDGSYIAVTETCRFAEDAEPGRAREMVSVIRAAGAETAGAADERPFMRALEAMGAGVLITDPNAPDNPIIFANSAALAITGYSMAELIGRNARLLQGPDTDREAVAAIRSAMAEERPVAATLVNHRRDGTPFRSRLHISPIHNARKRLQAFVAVFFDLGAIEAVPRRPDVPADLPVAAFIATMSEELRTPLNSVIGFSDLLLEGALAPEQRRYASFVRNAGRSIRAIIDDAIDLAALEATPEAAEAPFSIAELALGCSSVVWHAAREKGLELNFVMKPDVIDAVRGYPDRLRHVLLDLLGNAVRSTEKGGITLSAARLADSDGKTVVRFSVADTGLGLPPERQQSLFEGGARRGGLALCRTLVERMGGTIGVNSAPGRGSELWFTLPLKATEGATANARLRARKQARILLAEDTPMNQELVVALLTRAGHEVEVAPDGMAALEALKKRPFDLVLLDLQMPQMDGLKAAEAIRAMGGALKELPIIALTAKASPKDAARCRAAGMNDHVAKPIGASDLLAIVDRWLAKAGAATKPAAPRRMTATAKPPLVDKKALDALERDLGPDKAARMVDAAIKEIPERLERMLRQVSDRARIAEDAHELVAVAGNLGLNELTAQCRRLAEVDGDADDWQVGVMVENVKTAAERAIAAMRRAERPPPAE